MGFSQLEIKMIFKKEGALWVRESFYRKGARQSSIYSWSHGARSERGCCSEEVTTWGLKAHLGWHVMSPSTESTRMMGWGWRGSRWLPKATGA